MRLRSSYERPNRNKLHAQLASGNSFPHPVEDVSKWPKFRSVLSALRPKQQLVVPLDVQVIFVLGLVLRQNESAFVHWMALQHTPSACGSQNHELFVTKRIHGINTRGAPRGDVAGGEADECQQGCHGRKGCGIGRRNLVEQTRHKACEK